MNSSSMQVISVLWSSSNTTSEESSAHSRSILRNLSGAPAGEMWDVRPNKGSVWTVLTDHLAHCCMSDRQARCIVVSELRTLQTPGSSEGCCSSSWRPWWCWRGRTGRWPGRRWCQCRAPWCSWRNWPVANTESFLQNLVLRTKLSPPILNCYFIKPLERLILGSIIHYFLYTKIFVIIKFIFLK